MERVKWTPLSHLGLRRFQRLFYSAFWAQIARWAHAWMLSHKISFEFCGREKNFFKVFKICTNTFFAIFRECLTTYLLNLLVGHLNKDLGEGFPHEQHLKLFSSLVVATASVCLFAYHFLESIFVVLVIRRLRPLEWIFSHGSSFAVIMLLVWLRVLK